MSEAPFSLSVSATGRHLGIVLSGYWTDVTAEYYVAALGKCVANMSRDAGKRFWLIDTSDFSVQSNNVTEVLKVALRHLVTSDDVIALVTSKALSTMQARRTAPFGAHSHFGTRAEAERWLAEQESSARISAI